MMKILRLPADDCLRDPGGAGYRPIFHATPHRRDCISVPRLPPFAVWAASGGWFSALGSGRRQVCYVSISGKLTSGQHGPKQERVASSHPFLLYSISTYEKDCGASVIL